MSEKIYNEVAEWYPLLTSLSDYKEEVDFFRKLLVENTSHHGSTMLELGCGAGYNAFYLKEWYQLTLSDLSEKMVALSESINPECKHVQGDMRDLRLNQTFDIVFIHDAIMYMKSAEDLRRAIVTASVHCRQDGTLLIVPDCVKETFKPSTEHGGQDNDGKSLRYLEWITGPNPDGTYNADFIIALREANGELKTFHERHEQGLFSLDEWMRFLNDGGFIPSSLEDPFGRIVFLCAKR